MATKRNYKKEYETYQGTEEQKKNRAQRNKARRMLVAEGVVKKGDGVDVDHIQSLKGGGETVRSNLRPRTVKKNRGDKTF